MKRFITPTWTINSIYSIKGQDLLKHGYRAVIVDLDNTLIAWNQWEHTVEMAEWMIDLRQAGVKVYLLSNNNHSRVAKVADPLEVPFTAGALKPLSKNFKLAVDHLTTPNENIVVIGDQVMTDVIGANRFGLDVILVKPIAQNDNIYTWLNRSLEKVALKIVKIDRKGNWGNKLD